MASRRVLITGGAGSLACVLAGEFTGAGYEVFHPGRAELDVTNPDSVLRWFDNHPGGFDCVVLNAGVTRDRVLSGLEPADWDEVMAGNLDGAARVARVALQNNGEGGHLIMISSHSAVLGHAGQTAYAAAKAALIALMQSLARELGRRGTRVNAVMPGVLPTRLLEKLKPARVEELKKAGVLGRFNDCSAVARFLVFLDRDLPHTSGQVFQLDNRIIPWT